MTHTDERGLVTTYDYDNLQRVKSISDSRGTISYRYDKLDLIEVIDRLGLTNRYVYDNVRRLIATTNALGRSTLYNYCNCGALDTIRDAEGNLTQYFYDNAGRLLNVVYPDGYSITNRYSLIGQVTNVTDSAGISTTNWFNNQGLLYASLNGVGQTKGIAFDIEDRPVYMLDANGVTVTNVFDTAGRLLSRTYPDGGAENLGYTLRGLAAYTNQIGNSNFFVYDAAGRKTFETNANNEVIKYTYQPGGELATLTDGKNQVTTWNYDEFGRLTNKVDQFSVEILRYKYDADNRLTNRWSKARGDTKYAYDSVGNLTNIDYPGSSDVRFQFDALNRMTNMVDDIGTTVYAYTAGGQLLTEDGPFASDTLTNTYVSRFRTGLGLQQPSGNWTNGFGYDPAGQLTNVTSQAGSFGYELAATAPASPLIHKVLLPNGAYITNSYDNAARAVTNRLNNSSHTTLDVYGYVYNQANQRTSVSRTDGSAYSFSYDKIGQLKVADSTVPAEDRGYYYDAAWNLNRRTNNGTTGTFTINGLNEVIAAPSFSSLTYDNNGNLKSKGTQYAFAYDDENRLQAWSYSATSTPSTGDLQSHFYYDGLGRLRVRQESHFQASGGDDCSRAQGAPETLVPDSGPTGTWIIDSETHYIYDGMRVIQERDENNTPLVSYTRGRDLSGTLEGAGGIGGLLARSTGSSGSWTTHNTYFADGNGNVTYMLNSSQSMVASYRYDPFGNTISASGALSGDNVYRFSSKEIHVSSGMYYYLYRFYDPNLQGWINRDPLAEFGGINVYSFVGRNPLSTVDPNGSIGMVVAAVVCVSTFIAGLAMEAWEDLYPEPAEPVFGEDDDDSLQATDQQTDPKFHFPWWDDPKDTPDWLKFAPGATYPHGQGSNCPPKNRWRRALPEDNHADWPIYEVPPRSRPSWVPRNQRPRDPRIPRNRPGNEGRIEYDFIYIVPNNEILHTAFVRQNEASFCSFADHEIKFA